MTSKIARAEIAVGLMLSGAAIYLRAIALASGGALWRDEANTVGLATLPRLTDVWANLQFDSFPMLWLLIVRAFAAVAGAYNDSAFRALGFVIGLALIAALWINARSFGYRAPLVALALFAVSPSVMIWGDSLRAYGLAMLLIFLTGSMLWRFVESPSALRFACAACVAILGVQTVYYNSAILLALCAGAVAACAMNRRWKTAASVVAIGAVAALSLVPYIATIRSASSWNSLVRIPGYSVEWFFLKLYESLFPGGGWTFIVWVTAAVAGTIGGLAAVMNPEWLGLSKKEREITVFALVSLVVGAIASFLFLRELSYYTQPWYYLTLLTVVAFGIDVLSGTLIRAPDKRGLRLVVVLAMGLATTFVGKAVVSERMTNADLVAVKIEQTARPGDIVIVNPWYYGVSFDRYYHGTSAWRTVPDIPFHRFHRYDLVMEATRQRNSYAMQSVIDDAQAALKQGNTVFVIGTFSLGRSQPQSVPIAGDQQIQNRWMSAVYDSLMEAGTITDIPIVSPNHVSRYENLRVTALRGWQ